MKAYLMCAESRGVKSIALERRNFLKPLSLKLRVLKNFILFVFCSECDQSKKYYITDGILFAINTTRIWSVENLCQEELSHSLNCLRVV